MTAQPAVRPGAAPSERPAVLVRADGLSAGYGGADVLREVSFELRAGERLGVLGPNGGGKTTLFRVLLGQLEPTGGRLERPRRCAVVPQTERSRLDFPVSAHDVALMGAVSRLPWYRRPGRADRAAAHAALEAVGLADRAAVRFGELSGGQRQRVLVARALVQDAQVILLDEPFSGLDTSSAERLDALLAALAAEGRALMIATHEVTQARRWGRVLCLNGRQVAHGDADLLTRDVLRATYGAEVVDLDCAEHGSDEVVLPAHHHH